MKTGALLSSGYFTTSARCRNGSRTTLTLCAHGEPDAVEADGVRRWSRESVIAFDLAAADGRVRGTRPASGPRGLREFGLLAQRLIRGPRSSPSAQGHSRGYLPRPPSELTAMRARDLRSFTGWVEDGGTIEGSGCGASSLAAAPLSNGLPQCNGGARRYHEESLAKLCSFSVGLACARGDALGPGLQRMNAGRTTGAQERSGHVSHAC